jgi:hypothetical protein
MTVETKHYSDGTSATGTAPLPDLSPAQQDALTAATLTVVSADGVVREVPLTEASDT